MHDRLSRRSLRHLLTRANAENRVYEEADGSLAAYCTVTFNRATALARLYSIAVDPAARGRGLGREMVAAAEAVAAERGCVAMRLEVHVDNAAAIALYRSAGYEDLGRYQDYYEDHGDALRLQRRLAPGGTPETRVPYYAQRYDFTCGPAALMMAMAALDPRLVPEERLELRLWREATTIFMSAGHGGCGPFGLALAAHRRGLRPTIYASDSDEALFADGVRDPDKKRAIRLVEADMLEQLEALALPVHREPLGIDTLRAALERGEQALILISLYRLTGERSPHWVTVTGMDEHHVYVHEPYVDRERGRDETDCLHLPIQHREFQGLARYGRRHLRAAVLIAAAEAP